jgi:hypothetical protein
MLCDRSRQDQEIDIDVKKASLMWKKYFITILDVVPEKIKEKTSVFYFIAPRENYHKLIQ